jgi:N6-adenosine-specific RNA methylase IME4
MTASVIVADPPWEFRDTCPGNGRGAAKHYPCMGVEAIKAFPLPPLAPDAVLLLWRVASMQREALDVMDAWGFDLKTEIVWRKLTKHGKQHFGMGHYVRASHEVCLLGTRGRWKPRARNVRSVFDAPVGRHSEKPGRFFALVEELAAGPYVELFARRHREGWQCHGNELEEAA